MIEDILKERQKTHGNFHEKIMNIDPRQLAYDIIDEMIAEGLKKHQSEAWRYEPEDNHLDKCIRHIMTHKLIRDGNSPDDGEMHLKNALCRLAMALARNK